MIALVRWCVRTLGANTLVILVLLWCAFATTAYALRQVVRGFDEVSAIALMTLALLVGGALARFPGWLAALIAMLLGGEVVLVRVGQLGDKLGALARTLAIVARETWDVPRGKAIDVAPTLRALGELWNAIAILLARLRDWLGAMASGVPAFDPVAAALAWGLVAWAIASWASWHALRRHSPLVALAPCLALLAAVLAYAGGNPDYLLVMLAVILVLFVVCAQSEREHRWRVNHIPAAEDLPFDLAITGVSFSLILMILAASIPSFSLDDVIRWTQELTRERVEVNRVTESFGLQPQPAPSQPTIFDVMRAPGLPTKHLLGTGAELSRLVVMTIQTDDTHVESPEEYVAPPHYWRGSTYDRYTGRGWVTSDTEITAYQAGESADGGLTLTQRTVQQEFHRVRETSGLLFATGTLVTADHDFRIARRANGDVFSAELRATNYRAESRVLSLDVEQLRQAGTLYPAEIRAHYLDLPDDVPLRVLTLARDLTATQPTPYERARAIENYLREFPYTLDLPAPPPNRDVMDYFLFDLQKGYCDYFASAMVVLARAAGMPARLVVGYAPGVFDPINARYIVTEADAHAWAELYFPDAGWVEFEATSNRPARQYSAQNTSDETQKLPKANKTLTNLTTTEMDWGWILFAVVALVLGGIGAVFASDELRLRRRPPIATVREIYRRLAWYAARFGVRAHASDTPSEFAEKLTRQVNARAMIARDLDALIDAYVLCQYSPRKPDKATQTRALRTWQHVRAELWKLWARRSVGR
ncbi:MAG: transglutaminase domain-containing protein [Chloroflexi bacterium]|nr:transglutaminase domain-containing protein [Chloroflexota bacterium]